jgi:hypothetical protein
MKYGSSFIILKKNALLRISSNDRVGCDAVVHLYNIFYMRFFFSLRLNGVVVCIVGACSNMSRFETLCYVFSYSSFLLFFSFQHNVCINYE